MLIKSADAGEYIRLGVLITDPITGQAVDVTGCSVSAVVRVGPASTDTAASGSPFSGTVVSGPRGDVEVGLRLAAGIYYAAITVDRSGAAGWPVVEVVKLVVSDHP